MELQVSDKVVLSYVYVICGIEVCLSVGSWNIT